MAELSKLGRYELRRVLGRGAMGVVYEGFDPTLGRRVAVKTILKGATLDEETERAYSARFVKEAKAVARLNHPNIVQVHDFGEENEIAYLVMEFIQGRELRSFFAAGERFEPAESVRIMGELLDALDFAHEVGVVHRDVKPANVMLDAQRRVKLADFGVARVQDGAEQSMAGTMVGTPAFMSPEQISGGKIDRRTDVFSAGTILYQLLTGEQPFKGDGAWTVAKQIMQDDPARPSSIVTNLPPAFDEVVSRALAKSPAQRFASAREFADALRSVLGGTQPAATSAGKPAPKPKAAAAAQTSEAEVEFWRSIQNSNDAEEFKVYLEAFPEGTYSQLARLKMAKLTAAPAQDAQATVRLEAEAKARHEAEEKIRQVQALEKAKREALEKARREVEEKSRREALEKAKREAEEKSRREAEERARRVAEEKARRDAEEKAKRDAAEKVKREAAEKAKREAEEKIRQAQALARLKQQEEAAARARAAADDDATVSIGSAKPTAPLPAERGKPTVLPAVAAAAVVMVVGIGAYLFLGRTPAPVAQAPVPVAAPPPKTEASAADIEKIRKEVEERIRREYADKSAAEQAAAAKAASEKAVQEKNLALKAAAEKAAAEKAAAEKAAAEKAAAEKALTAKAAAERAAAEKAAAEKAAAEKAAAERAAAEKVAAEKAATEKAAAEKAAAEKATAERATVVAKPGWPSQGDRWVYEAREANNPDKKYQVGVEIVSVSSNGIHDSFRASSGSASNWHYAAANLVGEAPGIFSFVPYLRAFQEVNVNVKWNKFPIRVRGCAPQGGWTCIADARVVGRERVSVRAGSFETWKIVVEMGMRGSGGGTYAAQITYWYAEEAKRFVKYESRIRNPYYPQPSMDMELLSYTPAGTK